MREYSRRKKFAIVLLFILASVVAGVVSDFLEKVTGQTWIIYVAVGIVTLPAVISLADSGILTPKINSHEGESWLAAIPLSSGNSIFGGMSKIGGTLALRNEDLRFLPMWNLGRTRRFPLSSIESVLTFGDKPPRLQITTTDRVSLVLIVGPPNIRWTWNADSSARDEAINEIKERINSRYPEP